MKHDLHTNMTNQYGHPTLPWSIPTMPVQNLTVHHCLCHLYFQYRRQKELNDTPEYSTTSRMQPILAEDTVALHNCHHYHHPSTNISSKGAQMTPKNIVSIETIMAGNFSVEQFVIQADKRMKIKYFFPYTYANLMCYVLYRNNENTVTVLDTYSDTHLIP